MSLTNELAAFISPLAPAERGNSFEVLALRLFAYQYAHNLPYQRLCNGRGQTPETVTRWQDIPAAPASAFKRFALTCVPESECVKVFHSSGTTGGETSRHFMSVDARELYKISLKAGYARAFGPEPPRLLALMPPTDTAPHSSLSFMLETLGAEFLWGESSADQLRHTLASLSASCTLFGTAFAWVNFFDATQGECFPLPEGSLVIETGGFKGRSREVEKSELYALFTERLEVATAHCFSEYGMSELTSQFYSQGLTGPKLAPPWLKTRLLDPVTGTDAVPGQPGLLAHYDLANYNSVLAIQTEDRGVWDERGGFQLLGRAPGAVLRGCSLLAE
ncbi:long-chain fatty acid--CoA ligase [Armatimonas sp.]|uniref:LuxE/PaaK family acyltransferase n=1 Tax=Armatimonas sp. TaxID=1872638 RepID=UPI003750A326